MITKNAIMCNHCKKVLQSWGRHDFKMHSCPEMVAAYPAMEYPPMIAVDGGHDYLRRLGQRSDYMELSEDSDEVQ